MTNREIIIKRITELMPGMSDGKLLDMVGNIFGEEPDMLRICEWCKRKYGAGCEPCENLGDCPDKDFLNAEGDADNA